MRRIRAAALFALAAEFAAARTLLAQVHSHADSVPPGVAPAVAAAHHFHTLLASNDSAGVVRLLAPDLVVVESGYVETRAEYLGHHLGADMKFAKAAPARRALVSAHREGDVVWIVTSSTASGKMGDRQIESRGAELMVVARSDTNWLIRAIHWSAQPRRDAAPPPP